MRIERITALPDGIDVMRAEAVAEGFDHIETLWRQWQEGFRFTRFGEMLVAAFVDDELAGIGGVTEDFIDPTCLRMRRFYERPKFRRLGVARALAVYLIRRALTVHRPIVLFTDTARGAAFWESMGFVPTEREKATHILPEAKDDFDLSKLERWEHVAGALAYWLLQDILYAQLHTRMAGELAIAVFAENVGLEADAVRSTAAWADRFEMRMLTALVPLVEARSRMNEPGLFYDTPRFKSTDTRLHHSFMSAEEKAFGVLADCGLIETDPSDGSVGEWNVAGRQFIDGIHRYDRTVEILRGGKLV
jgi:GNAT superfamily N-acetyltransferase